MPLIDEQVEPRGVVLPSSVYQPFHIAGKRRGQIWRYAPEYRYRRPRHFHNEPELNLVVAGRGRFGTGAVSIDVAPLDLLCWPPGCDHELLEASSDFDLFVIGLTPELLGRVLGRQTSHAFSAPLRLCLSAAEFARFYPLCVVPGANVEAAVVETRVGDLWRSAHAAQLKRADKISAGRRALLSVLADPDLERNARARSLRAHPSEVSRQFHREMGITLTAYRTRLRLIRFIQLMDGNTRGMLQCALEAGFGSYSQCHRAFVRDLACSPRQFFGQANIRSRMYDDFSALPSAK